MAVVVFCTNLSENPELQASFVKFSDEWSVAFSLYSD